VAVQSPETTQGRDARSTVAEMESQEIARSTGVNSYVACLMLARLRHAAMSVLRSLVGVNRTLPMSFNTAVAPWPRPRRPFKR